jgi:hypothetical protein
MQEREMLLLQDDSDKQIAELDAAADRCRLTLERIEKAEPLLLAELGPFARRRSRRAGAT